MKNGKSGTVTFKVDESLLEAMKGMSNRSDFIRRAVVAALEGDCPLCKGTGVLTPRQRGHWDAFAVDHALKECDDCHETYLVCSNRAKGKRRSRSKTKCSL